MTFRILSFDGGGIRGVIAATMLATIEKMIGQPLNQYFNLIAGTSTGAVLAAGIATGLQPSQMVELYQRKGSRIFPYRSIWSPQRAGLVLQYGISAPKYSDSGLIAVLKEEFKYKKLSDITSTNLLVTAYDTIGREPLIFKSWRKIFGDLPVWEACVCSASAPTFFPAHRLDRKEEGKAQGGDINTITLSPEAADDNSDYNQMLIEIIGGTGRGQTRTIIGYRGVIHQAIVDEPWAVVPDTASIYRVTKVYSVIDGGVGANNPTACAIAEALRLGYEPKDLSVLSVGTGSLTREIPLESAQQWGATQWALPILDVIFDASSDINNYIAKQIIQDNRYLRLQFRLDSKLTGKRLSDDIDDASPVNIANLVEAARVYISQRPVQEALMSLLKY